MSAPRDGVVEDQRATANGWVGEVTVRKDGDATVAGAQLRGASGKQAAKSDLDYVPAHGHAEAGLRFEQAPGADLTVAVVGWRAP